jgi:Uncharacterised nucleotidyltransferase
MATQIELCLLEYLNFRDAAVPAPPLSESVWQRALTITDAAGLTLHLLGKLRERDHWMALPEPIRERLKNNERDHVARIAAASQEFVEFNRLLQSHSVRYLALKGLTCWPDFVDRPEHRVQYDHDFLIATPDLQRALELFEKLGYTPLESGKKLPVDHLPTLVKRTGWVWKGNLYDPEIPRAIELHFRLYDPEFDLIPIRFPDDLWIRATQRRFQGTPVPVLGREHALLYGVFHAFRHLVRNDLRLSHLYEISYFLHSQCDDDAFWKTFLQEGHFCPQSLKVTATIFALARRCFGNQTSLAVDQLIREHLPPAAAVWIEQFGRSEAMACFRKSKNTFLLHWIFVKGPARWRLFRRHWVPRHLPLSSFGVQVPTEKRGFAFRFARRLYYAGQLLLRACFHISAFGQFVVVFPVWQWRLQRRVRYLSLETKH